MNGQRVVNVRLVARGEDLGNGFCVVPLEWLPEKIADVAEQNKLVWNGKCIISNEFIDKPWHADAVYSMDFATKYDETDLR